MTYPNLNKEKWLAKSGVKSWLGMDEAGRGALAGPLVAAAVCLDWNGVKILKHKLKSELRESKLLSEARREKIFDQLESAVAWSIGVVSNQEIDQLGIGRSNVLAFERAAGGIRLSYDYLLLDFVYGFKHFKPFETIKDGDYKIYSIALASIFAKVSRDRLMRGYHQQYPDYGFARHKGYGTRAHLQQLQQCGPTSLHRLSFNWRQATFN